MWIGLHSPQANGNFVSLNNATPDCIPWNVKSNEPNSPGVENCGFVWLNVTGDIECAVALNRAVCQRISCK